MPGPQGGGWRAGIRGEWAWMRTEARLAAPAVLAPFLPVWPQSVGIEFAGTVSSHLPKLCKVLRPWNEGTTGTLQPTNWHRSTRANLCPNLTAKSTKVLMWSFMTGTGRYSTCRGRMHAMVPKSCWEFSHVKSTKSCLRCDHHDRQFSPWRLSIFYEAQCLR